MHGLNTSTTSVASDRTSHWIKPNHQTRMPKRWVAFDSEATSTYSGNEEIQTWKMGAAIRWRTDLKTGDRAEAQTFDSALALWQWVTDFCKPGTRTVAIAHNLGYDTRITGILEILPQLGWTLEWLNLDRSVSAMTWRGEHGTLVLCDLWTWLPVDLHAIGLSIELPKLTMPPDNAKHSRWERYCMRDAEIVYRAASELIGFIQRNGLGNWQPTGAGMAYATWRHKFMNHKILVHDDEEALIAEREAMHTGRAEAWRHGELLDDVWTEVDMRNAYVTIASECDLPTKLKMKVGAISNAQYDTLCRTYRVLVFCRVHTRLPVVPYRSKGKTIWPIGTFETWLWDVEVDSVRRYGGSVAIKDALLYTRAPILQEWARWVLDILCASDSEVSPVVRTWLKHCARALIGRISLRCPNWQLFGENPEHITGITHELDTRNGKSHRLLHVGNETFRESDRTEGRDSLPQITGWIMAECRVRLWEALSVAGEDHVAHADTDAILVDRAGLRALQDQLGADFARRWAVKGSAGRVIVYGPRNYRIGVRRKAAGVPKKAKEVLPNVFHGEKWMGMSSDLESGRPCAVTIETAKWELTKTDPRRLDAPGAGTGTVAIQLAAVAGVSSSSSGKLASGA